MTSIIKSGSSRRKAETPGKIRIQLKGKHSKVINSEDEEEPLDDKMKDVNDEDDDSDNLPVTFDSGIPDDLPEGTFVVQPEPVEDGLVKDDSLVKKKREAVVRIDTSVLDNVSCTACGRQVNPYKNGALQKHPVLKVVICKRCEKFLSSGKISKDKDGIDEQCQWCGEGGRLVVCDDCASAFCKACVMRNFNRSEFNNINGQEKWKCYLCNKAPLQGLRENYRKIKDTLKALQDKDKAKAGTLAAHPSNNGMQPFEKTAGSIQISTFLSHNSVTKDGRNSSASFSGGNMSAAFSGGNMSAAFSGGNMSSAAFYGGNLSAAVSAQKSSSSSEGITAYPTSFQKSNPESIPKLPTIGAVNNINFNLEETILTLENVFGVVDKLVIATNSFREMLQVLQSQSHFPVSGNTNVHSLRLRCVKALNMGLENYLKSLNTILFGFQYSHQNMTQLAYNPDILQANLTGLDPTSAISASEAYLLSSLSANPRFNSVGPSLSLQSNGSFIDPYLAQSYSTMASINRYMPEIKQETNTEIFSEKANSIKENNNSLISKNYSCEQSNKDSHKISQTAEEKSLKFGPIWVEDSFKSTTKDPNVENANSCKDKSTSEEQKAHTKSIVVGKVLKINKEMLQSKNDLGVSNVSSSKSQTLSNKGSGKHEKAAAGNDKCTNDIEQGTDEKVDNAALHNLSNKLTEDEPVPKSKGYSVSAEENLGERSHLLKELGDKIVKDVEVKVDRNNVGGDDSKPSDVKFDKAVKDIQDAKSSTSTKSKLKSLQISSAANVAVSEKIIKGLSLKKVVVQPVKTTGEECQNMKNIKSESEHANEVVATPSTSLLSSDEDDDVNLATRRQKQKKIMKSAEKTLIPARLKQDKLRNELKAKTNGKPVTKPTLDNQKTNEKNVKDNSDDAVVNSTELSQRKRKASDLDMDKEGGEKMVKVDCTPDKGLMKKIKPGPKSSKQDMDNENNLPSCDDMKDNEENASDEDEPVVTFCLDPAEFEDQKDLSDEGNENNTGTKNGASDILEDDTEGGPSVHNSDGAKKTRNRKSKKPQKKITKDSSEEEEDDDDDDKDSDEGSGKQKKSNNKPTDTKSSGSDSDIGKPKKKKKDVEDDDSFKGEDSSNSSIESDLSDSEDVDDSEGEDEDGEPKSKKKKKSKKKRRKRKGKKGGGDENEEEDEDEEKGKKKKGKGKKTVKKSSSDEDEDAEEKDEDDEDDDPNSSKAGKRKQIRKVMSNKRLEDSTKAAAKKEEKRRKRIAAKQREFNIETITDKNNPMNCLITTKLILEMSKEEGDEPLIQVNKSLVRKLKPHQVEAVQFMWDCMYESVKRSKKEQGAGCILAHCMGLGKTLSVIAFVHTILSHEKILNHRTCLVVSPLNTVLNWRNEWGMWLEEEDQLEVWELASCKQNAARAEALKEWQQNGGIMIMGYEMYRNLTTGSRCKNKRQKKVFQDTLVDPGPDLVICDEGHILKNEASAISKAMNQMKTKRRVVLTGTPLQNNLNEYHCMVSFVKPSLLGTRKEFNNRFISPIQNGQCTDSTPRDVKIMKARAHVLHEMLAGCVQRRDYSALTKFLPPKQEYVISVRLTNIQIELYEKYLEMTGQGLDGVFSNKGARLFADYQNLMKIWTHPWVLKLAEIRDELKMKYDDDEDSFIDEDSDEDKSFSSSSSSSDDDKGTSDVSGKGSSSKINMQRGTRRTRAKARRQAGEDSDPEEVIAEWKSKTRTKYGDDEAKMEETNKFVTKEWWAQYVTEDDKLKLELSNKLHLLFEILRMCEEIGDKVLIFSQSILSLNIIESFLEVVDSKFQQECENLTDEDKEKELFGKSWTKNLDYYRMDGSTSAQNRQLWASNFNDLENYRARLFLISTRAGGLGINLVAANRVIIFDASWNPSHDVQSIFRVYRFGQTKPCYIYRFLAQGTMEDKIYERQVTKLSLSQRVVDEHQIERHFSANDLKELYNFRPDRWDDGTEKPTLALPKDPLLAEILTANKHCVVSFHEHDSLLENQIEQTLTEEEKKAAWEEYENEKKGIIIRGPGMERTASWPMMAAAQILSREQITATVQALRQQLPDISEDLFHLHVQQALRRQVQIKQEEMRRMELLRLQEMNYLNMIKQQAQQSGLTHAQSLQAMQNMAPWMQIQRLRAMQQSMLMGGGHLGMLPSASMSLLSQALNNTISNKPEEAINLDDN